MTELGNRLKEAREEKGISLDKLQEITKIQKRYLIGIEQGNYDMIPGKFYVRAFIKQYAEAVGLQPELLFDEFRSEIPSVYEDDLPEQISRTQSRKVVSRAPSKIFDLLPKIIFALFIIGAVWLIWFFIQKYLVSDDAVTEKPIENEQISFESEGTPQEEDNSEETTDESNAGENKEDETTDADVDQEEEPAEEVKTQEIAVVETSGSNTTYELRNADTIELRLASPADGRAWIQVLNGKDEQIFSGEISNGNEQTFDVSTEESVWIRTGRAYETEIYLNGEKLEYALEPNENEVQNITIKFVKDEQ
ncbi:helix-turn-helix domain-containing protein [Caldibacillus lycopersici]|uniref:Helix-turn-helix domain-containing protein n=1 Tax=Perspicuibacillus lycopersici TaxID=1325689 RepID=A0AAE3IRF4_9BACI|nr:helix-turn-helix domain-containing protein [Perspicuibacillus lycopersici]MCU9612036.1 helix-turn-helix domain-containing protein [Perspicuibacillus lycopersici]